MTAVDEVRVLLRQVRGRWAGVALTTAVARAVAGASVVVLAGAAAERMLAPADVPLMLLVAATAVGAAGLAGWMLARVRWRPTDRQVARFIEERCLELEDRLASAADVLQQDARGQLRDLMLADAAGRARAVRPDRIITTEALRGAAGRLAAAVSLFVIATVAALAPASRALRVARLHLAPGAVAISVEPGDARVVAGRPLSIRARMVGLSSPYDGDPPTLVVTVGDQARAKAMRRVADRFEFDVPAVETAFRYRVTAGRVSSREFTVATIHPPRVERIDAEYEYPSFMKLAPRREVDGGDIYAPAGTRVRLHVHADKPLRSGALTMGDGARIDLAPAGDTELDGALRVASDGSYRVALADVDGLESAGETEYFIRVMNDRPPDVRILRPAGDRKVTPLEEVTIEARADDDYGIDRFELVYAVRGRQDQVVPLRGGGSKTSRTGSYLLFVEDLGIQPGDFITYYARARDVGRGKRSTEARSDIYFLEVKPFDEEFVAATSQAMAGGRSGRSLEQLIAAQKGIISATWKLDRRAIAGRSDEDIKAVARAQGELKVQADAAAGPVRAVTGRRRDAQSGEGAGGPLARAADAMGRAQAHLDARRTAEALPAEMEALNELLRAEAEARRRQVSRQQQASAGGGVGRQGRDLSTLFDRELQRQQASNYEAPRQGGGEQAPRDKDPLEEIGELARRQNELSQQQRDLARATLEPEELKRQLERLTREQNDLRQRAEEAARQLAQQPSPDRPPGQPRSPASSDQRLRDIAGEMRGAAGDLRRQDLDAAGQRSARAADELRELERQLREARPDQRARALGELQLEARQVADEQQRIANQARQLAERGPGAQQGDARRRLAGDKDRLADRVERFEQTARRLASGAAQGPIAEASQELDRARLSTRMRESADRLREPVGSPSSADPDAQPTPVGIAQQDEQFARTLDRVARTLGEAGGSPADAATRDLVDRLARVRALRDRLGELERRADRIGRDPDAGREPSPPRGTDRPQPGQNPASQPDAAGRDRRQGAQGSSGSSLGEELARLQQEYARELRQAQELVGQLRTLSDELGRGLTPEAHEYSMGAPGTQAFKQDYSRWESLRREVALALERYEEAVSETLAGKLTADRMNAGASVELPEEYRALVARYYEALAKRKK